MATYRKLAQFAQFTEQNYKSTKISLNSTITKTSTLTVKALIRTQSPKTLITHKTEAIIIPQTST